tara:strand:+ start:931 stop:1827 length:897 start_codon:yes stop_codon:yes gene_type:complete
MTYHNPVLLTESVEGLNIKPDGIYVDVTFGGGGHSREILKNLDNGFLYGFDQDLDAEKNSIESNKFKFIRSNFRYIKNFLRLEGIKEIDGLIADLGISSFQIDVPERGFAHRHDSIIDMRMNVDSDLDAKEILNSYSEVEIARILYDYGDIKQSRRIAKRIVQQRTIDEIHTTKDLIKILEGLYPKKLENKFLSRIFQALRIEVNDEINALKDLLTDAVDLLKTKGRLVVISYHSLEDKLIKNLITKGNVDGDVNTDFYGNQDKLFSSVNKKIIVPNEKECKKNSRARSAKLRIAEKI